MKAFHDIEAIHIREHDVQKNQIGQFLIEHCEYLTASCGQGKGIAFGLEDLVEQFQVFRHIVHDEHQRMFEISI